ncbi:MAG: hypothetical protein GM44_3280 [actinobacterium acAMD-2]|nr:MAG: hypothetical protein GM44_3280 [actinobacterium acAMD-2]
MVAALTVCACTAPLAVPSFATPPPTQPSAPSTIGGPALARTGTFVGGGTGVTAFPKVTMESFVVADANSGAILAARNAHKKRPPASTLKTLTALTILPRVRVDEKYQVIPADTFVEGSRVGLFPGSHYTLDNLFYALFLPSANDAANAIARSRGSVKGTVRLMNEEAQRLQAFDTTAKNPSGLDAKGQLSSAYDLALFGREGLKNPDFARYARTVRARFPDKEPKNPKVKRSSYQIYTENRLMAAGYKGMLGIKTGYTTKAQRTFIGAAERNGRRILITMMANQGPTKVDAKLLLDWGFVNAARISTPVGQLVDPTGPAPTYTPPPSATAQPVATPTTASRAADTQSRRTSPAQQFVLVFGIAFAGFLALIGYFSGGTKSRQRTQRPSSR